MNWLTTIGLLTGMHIPGKKYGIADRESRVDKHDMEWQLNQFVFHQINLIFGPFEVDLFASRLNNQDPKYVSRKADPGTWTIDAMLLDLTSDCL